MLFKSFTTILTLVCLLCLNSFSQAGEFEFKQSPGKVEIFSGDQSLATYVNLDPVTTRPYFAHVKTLQGTQVTRNHPPLADDPQDHATFHPGIFLAFGDINGNDYWRLKAKVVPIDISLNPEENMLVVRNQYLSQSEGKTVCTETCHYRFLKLAGGYVIDCNSSFQSDDLDFYFGDQEEMGLGVRVASPLREKGGNGRILNSTGQTSAKQTWGQPANWCDYSGTIAGNQVGVMIMAAPGNVRPSWWHNRDYGVFVANLFGRKAMRQGAPSRLVVNKGETFALRYGVFIHESTELTEQQLADTYQAYVKFLQER